MIHPNTELKKVSDAVGYGVFATEDIPAGTMIYVKDEMELIISLKKFQSLNPSLQDNLERYSYLDNRGNRVVSWDIGKYVNHNCGGNTMSTGYGFEIALRDIKKGEEICDEYGIFNLQYEMDCYCGNSNCRKNVFPTDFDKLYKTWDNQIKNVIFNVFNVHQPLLDQLDERTLEELKTLMQDPKKYKSVYKLRFKKDKIKSQLLTSISA